MIDQCCFNGRKEPEMSDEERNAMEEEKFEVDELDESQLEGVAGGDNTGCTVNESRCITPATKDTQT
jgi:hypothetical protein